MVLISISLMLCQPPVHGMPVYFLAFAGAYSPSHRG